ncbi:MAG TPA: hypothetical protein DHW65_08805 [Dehalococcoidia bacterium]|nr:hypothetical protein [Dehalococcoidia bacterium]
MPRSKKAPAKEGIAAQYRLDWQSTTWSRSAELLGFSCADELEPLDRFIGQDRAQEVIRFGLEVDKPGYNLFVTGLTGTGKTSAIKAHLQSVVDDLDRQEKRKLISDWTTYIILRTPTVPGPSVFPVAWGRCTASNSPWR